MPKNKSESAMEMLENGNGNANADTASKTRKAKASMTYFAGETEHNFPHQDATVIRTTFADGTVRDFDITSIGDNVRVCAVLQGIATRFQRSYQSEKEVDDVVSAYDATVDDLTNGIWIEVGTGEPKVTQLARAVELWLVNDRKEEVSEERKRKIIETLKDENTRKRSRENPQIAAHLAFLQLEAAQKRANDKAAAAANATVDESLAF